MTHAELLRIFPDAKTVDEAIILWSAARRRGRVAGRAALKFERATNPAFGKRPKFDANKPAIKHPTTKRPSKRLKNLPHPVASVFDLGALAL